MASQAINSQPSSGLATPIHNHLAAAMVNSFRVAAVLERLSVHLAAPPDPAGAQHPLGVEYYNLILALARGIDFAVANNDVPDKVERMPEVLKEVCRRRSDACSKALVMVLMISVKNACNVGWFPEKEKQELFNLYDDVGSCFYDPKDINSGADNSLSAISTVFNRYYPKMKVGQILSSLEVKPGYGAFVCDFNISKNKAHSPDDKIRLLVVHTDNMETPACIISPPQANFLINGKEVKGRTNVSMDTGPLLPTDVTTMLKYGTNLLQAVGQFNGHYFIALVFVSVTSKLDSSGLKDYVPSTAPAPDSDPDIIVGPSRISLNCPISRSRMQVPVKGQSCKHPQVSVTARSTCFDFSNYMDINSRRPSWRCPHCNQHVCYIDLCIDQSIAKILKEVGGDVTNVIVSPDGSWKAVMDSDEDIDMVSSRISTGEASGRKGSPDPAHGSDIMDLTEDKDEMDVVYIADEDVKPPVGLNQPFIDSRDSVHSHGDFWVQTSAGQPTSNTGLNSQFSNDGAFEPSMLANFTSPAITDSFPLPFSQGFHGLGNSNINSILQNELSTANTLQLGQSEMMGSILYNDNGSGSRHQIPANVTRTPRPMQGLPSQHETAHTLQRSRSDINLLIPNSSSVALPTVPPPLPPLSRSIPTSSPSSFQPLATLQALNRSTSSTPQQRPTQQQARQWISSAGLFTGLQNQHLQQALLPNRPPPMGQFPSSPRPMDQSPSTSRPPISQSPSTFRPPIGQSSSIPRPPISQSMSNPRPMDQSLSTPRPPTSPSLSSPRPMDQSPSTPRPPTSPSPCTRWHPVSVAQTQAIQTPTTSAAPHLRLPNHVPSRQPHPPTRPNAPPQIGTSRLPNSRTPASTEEQRGSNIAGGRPSLRDDGPVDLGTEQNWRPAGRMRGSITGRPVSDEISQLVIQPTQLTRPSGPLAPSNPASASLSAPPHLRASMSNKNTSAGTTQNK